MKIVELESLQAELSNVESILRSIPSVDLLGRMSFESKRKSIQEKLNNISSKWEKNAEVVVYFGGDPVNGSSSIRTDFTVRILDNFQDIVSAILASQSRNINSSGPIPKVKESMLCISGMARGSFGFILTEDSEINGLVESNLSKAVNSATNLIKNSTLNDDTLEEVIADTPERVIKSLKKFIGTLSKYNASIQLDTKTRKVIVDSDTVKITNTTIDTIQIKKEEDIVLVGIFKGVTGLTRNFNFIPVADNFQPYIYGKVASSIEDTFLDTMNREYMGKNCKGIFSITETQKIGTQKTQRRFVLTDIFPV